MNYTQKIKSQLKSIHSISDKNLKLKHSSHSKNLNQIFNPEEFDENELQYKTGQYSHRSAAEKEQTAKYVIYSSHGNSDEIKNYAKFTKSSQKSEKSEKTEKTEKPKQSFPLKAIPVRKIETSLTQKKLKSTKAELKSSLTGTSGSTKGKSSQSIIPKDSKKGLIKSKTSTKSTSKGNITTSKEINTSKPFLSSKTKIGQSQEKEKINIKEKGKDVWDQHSKYFISSSDKLSKALEKNYECMKFSLEKKKESAPTVMKRHSSYSKLSSGSQGIENDDSKTNIKVNNYIYDLRNSGVFEKEGESSLVTQNHPVTVKTSCIEESLNLLRIKLTTSLEKHSERTKALLKLHRILVSKMNLKK